MVNSKGFSSVLTISVLVGITVLIGGVFLFNSKTARSRSDVTAIATPSSNYAKDVNNSKSDTNVTVFGKLNQHIGSTQELKNCQNDMNCFIEASSNCTKAKVIYSYTLNIFGVKQTTSYLYEIRGMESDKCLFYLQTQKIDVEFPEDTPDDAIKEQSDLSKKLEGKDGQCKFNTKDLTNVLTNWSVGNFDSGTTSCDLTLKGNVCTTVGGDFGNASCTGTYFDHSL